MAAHLRIGSFSLRRLAQPSFYRSQALVSRRLVHRPTALLAATDSEFSAAKDRLNSLKEDPGNDVKLQIYALFKQATVGKCNTPKPGAFDFVGKAKWTAWTDLGDMTQEQAKNKYVDIVNNLVAAEGGTDTGGTAATTDSGMQTYTGLLYTVVDGVATITLNRPKKKNAITVAMYTEWANALKAAGEDSNVVLAVITGAGDYYCSGNDLNNFMGIDPSNMHEESEKSSHMLEGFVNSFVDFPKPLIIAVNGPAVGISVTTLGLADVVYASDRATFHTPFASLGQSPEGCSSYTFPKIMGTAKASEFLLFGKKLTAAEACERGLITEVIPDTQFRSEVERRAKEYAKLPKNALRLSKNLIRDAERERLHEVNRAECNLLVNRWTSEECMQAIMSFFSKAKL